MDARSELTTREHLIEALIGAAELEQAVICQYLFAAYSLISHPTEAGDHALQFESVREWKAQLLAVARNEMEHLGLVNNLLLAVGASPHFSCPLFPAPARGGPRGTWFELQPFSVPTLERFIEFERLHGESGNGFESTYDLYQKIRRGLTRLNDGQSPLFVGENELQITSGHIDLTPGWHDIRLVPIHDLPSALDVIDGILETGHAAACEGVVSHCDRFRNVLRDVLELQKQFPEFVPVRPVVCNPLTRIDGKADPRRCTPIDHSATCAAIQLFNAAYRLTLQLLTRFYAPGAESTSERLTIGKLALYPLMTLVLRPLGEMLTQMPAGKQFPGKSAGPTFEWTREPTLSPHPRSAWFALHDQLLDMVARCESLLDTLQSCSEPWSQDVRPRLKFLHENLQSIAVRLEHTVRLELESAALNLKKILDQP